MNAWAGALLCVFGLGQPCAWAQQPGESQAAAGPGALEPTANAASLPLARELTARARERFEAGDYGAALAEYQRAYRALAGDPRRAELLNNIAVCHERMFHYDLALAYYGQYLREGARDPADRAEVEAVVRGLRGLLGELRITSNVPSEAWLDDRLLGTLPGAFLVPAGTHLLEVRVRGYQSARRELRVDARSLESLHLELEPLPQYRGVERAYFWTGASLTAAALLTGSALGLRALDKQHAARARFERGLLTVDDERPIRKLALASDIAFGSALLFGVSTTVLFFVTDFRAKRDEQSGRAARRRWVALAPQLAPGAFGLGLRGVGW